LGSIIGHEIIHAFDSQGRWYNAQGEETDGWSNSTLSAWENRSQCFIKQFNQFKAQTSAGNWVSMDGTKTLDENIGDFQGLKQSYLSWRTLHHKNDLDLPGFEKFTLDQMFFMATAFGFCGKITPDFLAQAMVSKAHAPMHVRINGMMQNMPEFATAFQCRPGSTMNPTTKCAIW
jgi:endothelin-converting enzyme